MEVCPVSREAYAPLAEYLSAFERDSRTPEAWLERFRIWWDANPAFSEADPRGWILKDGNKIAGFLGNIPFFFSSEGRPVRAYTASTWRVLPDYRGYSLDLLRKFMRFTQNHFSVCTTPAPNVSEIFKKLGYEMIPRGDDRTGWSVIHFENVFGQVRGENFLSRLAAGIISGPLGWAQDRRLGAPGQEDRARECSAAGPAFDDLWEHTKNLYDFTDLRTSEALNWYCFADSARRKILFGTFQGDRLEAFMILSPRRAGRLKILECLDLWPEPGQDALRALLAGVRRYAREHAYDRISFPGFFSESNRRILKRLIFFKKKAKPRCEFYRMPGSKGESGTKGRIYFHYGEGDIAL